MKIFSNTLNTSHNSYLIANKLQTTKQSREFEKNQLKVFKIPDHYLSTFLILIFINFYFFYFLFLLIFIFFTFYFYYFNFINSYFY